MIYNDVSMTYIFKRNYIKGVSLGETFTSRLLCYYKNTNQLGPYKFYIPTLGISKQH
jgi:hypothetical protein